ncbi:MAG: hypothetical protein J3T61_03735 [Candidatus Brocadiales bacterium]|nr:hypothetical protein [Candidatus Bathyanammoxibius sp.]
MKLKIDQTHLRRFRLRAAKRAPQEYIEALYGFFNKSGDVQVTYFRRVSHVAGPAHISYNLAEWPTHLAKLKLVGAIHSHPFDPAKTYTPDCAPSEIDWEAAKDHFVLGICVVDAPTQHGYTSKKPRTRVKWFSAKAWIQVVA